MTRDYASAFPSSENLSDPDLFAGLSKREYFAARALQGIAASKPYEMSPMRQVEFAVELADMLIKELNTKTPQPSQTEAF